MHLHYCFFGNEMDILCTGHCIVNSSASQCCILMKAFSLVDANETALTFLQWHLMWLVCNSMWRDGSCDFGLCQCSMCSVESPAQLPPDPTWHLPYVPSLPPSVTLPPHWPPALYLWSTAWKGQPSRGKIHVRGGGEKSAGLLFGITGGNLHLSESLIEVSTYWIPKWTSLSNKVKTVKYESALFNYIAIESSLYRHFLGRLPVASLSLVAWQEFAKAILKIIKS